MKKSRKSLKIFLRVLALSLALLMLLPALVSCKARPLTRTKLASTEVGTVGDYTVLYEELYFLASNYAASMKGQYENDPEGLKAAVWEKVNENITSNYAILKLCEMEGLSYNEDELKEDIERNIEIQIESKFNGSRSEYFDSQLSVGLTDHYVRFVTGVDLLYSRLATKYKEAGIVPNTDEKIVEYIKANFVHTWHIAVFVNEGDARAEKLQKAEDALTLLENGMPMYDLIGSVYNEDLNPGSLNDAYGHYFPKGVMEQEYEAAAFSLGVGKHSGVVTGMGENNNGERVECFYVIERLPVLDEEIDANFNTLSDMLSSAIITEKVAAIEDTLSFTPNDYAKSLDITNLEQPKNGIDYQLIIVVFVCVLVVGGIIGAVIATRIVRTKKFHQKQQNKSIKRK